MALRFYLHLPVEVGDVLMVLAHHDRQPVEDLGSVVFEPVDLSRLDLDGGEAPVDLRAKHE